jgi:hypothetical protein
MRNLDSKIHLPGFDRFKFQFHSFFAETFSTASARSCREQPQQNSRVIRRLTEGMVVEKCIQC